MDILIYYILIKFIKFGLDLDRRGPITSCLLYWCHIFLLFLFDQFNFGNRGFVIQGASKSFLF